MDIDLHQLLRWWFGRPLALIRRPGRQQQAPLTSGITTVASAVLLFVLQEGALPVRLLNLVSIKRPVEASQYGLYCLTYLYCN